MDTLQLLKAFKWVSVLEGISLLVLLLIAMPLKYLMDKPESVQIIGMAHGVLFIAYAVMALWVKTKLESKFSTLLWVLAASVIPFGTFVMDKKYLNPAIQKIQ